MTHAEKVLALLSDGEPHSHREGYRLGVMLHSRVADLRKKGYAISLREVPLDERMKAARLCCQRAKTRRERLELFMAALSPSDRRYPVRV